MQGREYYTIFVVPRRWPIAAHAINAISDDDLMHCPRVCVLCLSVRCVGCACPGPGLGNSFEYGFRVFLNKKERRTQTAQC